MRSNFPAGKSALLRLMAGLGLVIVAMWAHADEQPIFVLVVHPDAPIDGLTRRAVSNLFLKKKTQWEDGSNVLPVDLPLGSPLRDAFSRSIHGRGSRAIDNYWQRTIYSGRGRPPLVVDSEAEVLAFVRANPGAIGYVAWPPVGGGVKIVELPGG